MSGCENSGGSCATRIAVSVLFPWPECVGCLVIRGYESYLCAGAEKNGVWPVRNFVPQLLRSATVGGPRSALRPDANLPGVGDTAGRLPEVRRGEARRSGLAGGQSVLHQTVCLLRGATVPGLDDQGGGPRTGPGLEDGQGVGKAVYAATRGAGWESGAAGKQERRGVGPQKAYLPGCA